MILRFAQLKRRIEYHCSEGAISLSAQAENITSRVSEIFHYYAAGMASRKAGAVIAAGFGRFVKRPFAGWRGCGGQVFVRRGGRLCPPQPKVVDAQGADRVVRPYGGFIVTGCHSFGRGGNRCLAGGAAPATPCEE